MICEFCHGLLANPETGEPCEECTGGIGHCCDGVQVQNLTEPDPFAELYADLGGEAGGA